MAVAPKPTTSEMREPYSSREKTSRPISSVPNQWLHDGRSTGNPDGWVGLWGAISPANAATSSRAASSVTASRLRRFATSGAHQRRGGGPGVANSATGSETSVMTA